MQCLRVVFEIFLMFGYFQLDMLNKLSESSLFKKKFQHWFPWAHTVSALVKVCHKKT